MIHKILCRIGFHRWFDSTPDVAVGLTVDETCCACGKTIAVRFYP